MDYINISHKKIFKGSVKDCSSKLNEARSAENLFNENGYWSTEKRDVLVNEYVTIDYKQLVTIDYIEIHPSSNGPAFFPKSFRLEGSIDNENWKIIHTEKNLKIDGTYTLDIPLTEVRYVKLVIIDMHNHDYKFFAEIDCLFAGISGLAGIEASSEENEDTTAKNLFDGNRQSFWASQPKSNSAKESLFIDLGKLFHINRIIIASASVAFPEHLTVEASVDDDIWMPLFDEKRFSSESYTKYYWDIDITPAQYIRIETKGVKYIGGNYGVQIGGIEISAAPFNPFHTHNIGNLTPYASIFQAGITKLAKDGEDSPGTVVQGSDRRLRDASTIFKGIVQLAEDKEETEGFVVQASDSRLKQATEIEHGIVRLAYDRENKPGKAVQSNDSRLQHATIEKFGIVKLCPDGEYNENQVITGNDPRIQSATIDKAGICILAENGSRKSGSVVQANDDRLREATTMYKGIVELAEDGEDNEHVVVQGNDRRLKDATTSSKGIVELAEDGEDNEGVVVQGNDQRLKNATTSSAGIVELAEDGEEKQGAVIQSNDSRLQEATAEAKGIVMLAKDGDTSPGVVVQGNDKRLRDATTLYKGIVEFAEDGEENEGVAVQGNDRRLKDATVSTKGIVELAEDGEEKEGVVVQGHDRRLKDATTDAKGIVELAEDGEDRPEVVVQGNDRRLKDATTDAKGIVELAEDGEDRPGVVVQGNDKRLKDATTQIKGIVELAEDGEDKEGVAVQGNDKRLKDATVNSKGLVELAEDGEEKEGVVVQGSDKRLKISSEESPGIVRLAKNKQSRPGFAVQAHDNRLSDAREPLPHEHDYAPREHGFNEHSGTIALKVEKNEVFKEIVPPSDNASVIYGQNVSTESCSIGVAGVAGVNTEKEIQAYGIVGHSRHVGVRGQASGGETVKGCGVLGLSRFGAGGVFASEHSYSLVADGFGDIKEYENGTSLIGNGNALLVNGTSLFDGKLYIQNSSREDDVQHPVNISEMFEVDDVEFISPGDILVASESGNAVLSRSRKAYACSVIGVVSGNASVIINNSGKEEKIYPVALAGKVMCKIDARNNPVNPGDLIVASDTPGCGMCGRIDSFDKIGSVIGKSLGKLADGIGIIPVFVTHQ